MTEESNSTIVTRQISFEPEIWIYVQKLANEKGIDESQIIDEIIREKALNEFKTIQYQPYRITEPSVVPNIQPYTVPWYEQTPKWICTTNKDNKSNITTYNSSDSK